MSTATPAPDRLRLAVATPLPPDAEAVLRAATHVELLFDPSLLPAQTFPSDHLGDPTFRRTPEQEVAFDALLARADAVYGIPGEDPSQLARVLRHCSARGGRLRWLSTTAAGGAAQIERAGLPAEVLDTVEFTTTAGVHAGPLADFALFGLLAGFQRLPALQRDQRAHHWGERGHFATPLAGSRVVVAGLGHLGTEIARRLRALGVTVTGTSRTVSEHPHADAVVHPSRLAEACAGAHALIVTLPEAAGTRRLVSAEVLAALRPGATVVNVGRGTVIDEPALVDALMRGHVGLAALDVFETEPLPSKSPLWSLDNVVVSPHAATLNPDEDRLIAELLVTNAHRLLNGEPLLNRVDTHEFDRAPSTGEH